MKILINQKEMVTDAAHLAALAEELGLPATGVAAAVAGKMVPRPAWADTPLYEGCPVTIIRAACGG